MARMRALSIAGSDPSGGAGIQADLRAFAAYGCHGMAVPVALTAQSALRVTGARGLDAPFVLEQIAVLLADAPPAAAKTGMLFDAATVRAVADAWGRARAIPLVVDPVLVATSGARLLAPEAEGELVRSILPLADLATPNVLEAAALAGVAVGDAASAVQAGRRILELGPGAVLVKGGHLGGAEAVDVLVVRGTLEPALFARPRISPGRRFHGAGCALSAAITAGLARGLGLRAAVEVAVRYVHAALLAGREEAPGVYVADHDVRVEGMPL
jgi:hydroxymethylpyrimidine/phosphomethylpyrimidine kinase